MTGNRDRGMTSVVSDRSLLSLSGAPLRVALVVVLAGFALALPVTPASASLYHPKPASCAFGEAGTEGSEFGFVSSIGGFREITALAFDEDDRRIYLVDKKPNPAQILGYGTSEVCPPAGYPRLPGFEPLILSHRIESSSALEVAIDQSGGTGTGRIYVAGAGWLFCYEPDAAPCPAPWPIKEVSGTGAHPWTGVAVDPSGDVWAGESAGLVHEFDPPGEELDSLNLKPTLGTFPGNFAFDAAGDLYVVASSTGGPVWKFPAPAFTDAPVEIDPGPYRFVTVDRSTGDVYVGGPGGIERYDEGGELVERFSVTGQSFGVAVDEASKAVYTYYQGATKKVQVFKAVVLPDLRNGPLADLAETSVTLTGAVHPDGVALTGCQFEWVSEASFLESGFEGASVEEAPCQPPSGSISSSGETEVSAAVTGLVAGERYRFRLDASNENGTNSSKPTSFVLSKPRVETVGSPVRTATTARLDSRVDPHGIPTEYHFEYLSEARFEADGGSFGEGTQTTPAGQAGSGGLVELVSGDVSGLEPDTTYYYRVLAGNSGFGEAAGEPRSLTTRPAAEEDLSHGPYPGPSGSDRAWEQVNEPDTGGNAVQGAAGIADDGEAAFYRVEGGTPSSVAGTLLDYLFARRPEGEHPTEGWRTEAVFPPRSQALFGAWRPPAAPGSLSSLLSVNLDLERGSAAGVWRIPTGGGTPSKLYETAPGEYANLYIFSDDASRAVLLLEGRNIDLDHPSPGGKAQLYDVSSGTPKMVLLPNGVIPSCGVTPAAGSPFTLPLEAVPRPTHWLSPDGSRLVFASSCETGASHLYMDDFDKEETVRVDGSPLAGPDCPGAMIRQTPNAVYFWTQSDLASFDTAIAGSCDSRPGEFTTGGDVYRYVFATGEEECLTCGLAGGQANAIVLPETEGAARAIGVAPDDSRLYFATRSHLLPGAADPGAPAIYRLDIADGSLAYVGPLAPGEYMGEDPTNGTELSPDGRYLAFRSEAPGLDALSGSDNGGKAQYYLYDDAERSLICVSCRPDGSAPRGAVDIGIIVGAQSSPDMTPLADDGDLAFATPTPLVGADRNTAPAGEPAGDGQDVYEWRDGRALLVSDGATDWSGGFPPRVSAISPSGHDLFFVESARLTPDALNSYQRLYDARIGGGIDFPPEGLPPCDLNSGACEGPASTGPDLPGAGSAAFEGPGNPAPKPGCPKGKVRRKAKGKKGKARCVARHTKHAKHKKHHAKGDRRTHR